MKHPCAQDFIRMVATFAVNLRSDSGYSRKYTSVTLSKKKRALSARFFWFHAGHCRLLRYLVDRICNLGTGDELVRFKIIAVKVDESFGLCIGSVGCIPHVEWNIVEYRKRYHVERFRVKGVDDNLECLGTGNRIVRTKCPIVISSDHFVDLRCIRI